MEIPKQWRWCNQKRHLVAEINDGDTELVVYKYWLRTRQMWCYKTDTREMIEYELELIARDKE